MDGISSVVSGPIMKQSSKYKTQIFVVSTRMKDDGCYHGCSSKRFVHSRNQLTIIYHSVGETEKVKLLKSNACTV